MMNSYMDSMNRSPRTINDLKLFLTVGLTAILTVSCASIHSTDVNRGNTGSNNLTVGVVQKEIKIGMPSSDVVLVLGSPNIVTTDDQRREQWVYDKVSSTVSASTSGIYLIFAGASAGASSSSQKTLTIIIKFDKEGKVRDFAYHNSKF